MSQVFECSLVLPFLRKISLYISLVLSAENFRVISFLISALRDSEAISLIDSFQGNGKRNVWIKLDRNMNRRDVVG